MSARYRIGVDIGGTFTDFVAMDLASGRLFFAKELTTPANPARAVLVGLDRLLEQHKVSLADTVDIIHGTTLATNAIIERKGARTALVTSAGFRDVLEIGRERRYDTYDLMVQMPVPLAPRELRWEVRERITVDGEIVEPLNDDDVQGVIEKLRGSQVESLAIVLLCSFRNPLHERRLRDRIRDAYPTLPISISADVDPQVREFDRTSTTVVNAYVQPIMERYLRSLEGDLKQKGYPGELHVMLSSGGIISSRTATEFPSRIIESGPAGGVAATAHYSRVGGEENLIAFDMGGTTAKICLIEGGTPSKVTETEVARVKWHKLGSGFPLRVPMIEMIEIGTGGGSIASINAMGLLEVGPHSAGAQPGPACYALGGTQPTMTDANLVLGYLDAAYFLGGAMQLDRTRAEEAIRRVLAEPLGLSVERAAWGIHEIATENMANAARLHAVSKGRDPAAYSLLAFGGAGALHAHRLATKLGIYRVLCPPGAGVMSALGFLLAPASYEVARGYRTALAAIEWDAIQEIYRAMRGQVTSFLEDARIAAGDIRFEPSALMSYEGQGYEVEVSLPGAAIENRDAAAIRTAFETRYRALYGQLNAEFDVQVLTWRLVGSGPLPEIRIATEDAAVGSDAGRAYKGKRRVFAGSEEGYQEWPVYDRYRLAPGARFEGPAVVEEREATVVVLDGAVVSVDARSTLIMDLRR